MLTALFLAAAFLMVLLVVSFAAGLISLVFGIVLLPFKLLGLVFRGLAAIVLLPLLLLLGLGLGLIVGIPLMFALALPLLPIVLLFAGIVWLAKRGVRSAAHTH